ncbi:MAG: hypothetical protein ACRDXX_08500, partial [Stackebrandtia sp.]
DPASPLPDAHRRPARRADRRRQSSRTGRPHMIRRTEAMSPTERVMAHTPLASGYCAQCWEEFDIRTAWPCQVYKGARLAQAKNKDSEDAEATPGRGESGG